jgi:glycosyltransferase involved in cell wall biosynthesis
LVLFSPKITTIIPVHNRFEFLGEALDSVFGQSRIPDEVILVDDCSTASVSDHLAGSPFAGKVKILRTDRNRRVAGARNWGWRHCTGDLVTFLDSDDVWELHKTQTELDFLAANPDVDGVYGGMIAFWPDGRTQAWGHDRQPTVNAKHALMGDNIAVQTLMIRREALEVLGGFDERFGILDDLEIAIRVARTGCKIHFLSDPPLTRLRRNDQNYSSHVWRYLVEECRIISENLELTHSIYGRGSERVQLGRAIKKFGCRTRLMGAPTELVAKLLYATSGSSMPRL